MIEKIKYFSFLTIFWLQFNIVFNEFNFSGFNNIQKILFIILVIINLINFIYFFLASIKKNIIFYKKIEKFFIILFTITSLFISVYYFFNPWTFKEHAWQSLVLEFTDIFIMLLAVFLLIISYCLSFKNKKINKFVKNKQQWSTKGTNDNIFLVLFIITSLISTYFSSQTIPYMNRNYFDFYKIFIVIFIIFFSLKYSKIFNNSREKFYLILSSYSFISTVNYFLTISVLDPFLKEKLINMDVSIFLVVIKEFFLMINLFILYIWLGRSFYLESKNYK